MISTQKEKLNYCLPEFYPLWMKDGFNYVEEKFINYIEKLNSIPIDVIPILNFTLFPGRRIRPILYCGFWKEIHGCYPSRKDLYPIYAIELFHSASIIIDDIVDKDDVRRNKDILYKNIGVENASIISHLLVSLGYKLLSSSSYPNERTRIWTDSYKMSAIGEFSDVFRFSSLSVEEQSKKALEKTRGFFVYIGKCLSLDNNLHEDSIKLFEILGDSFQISNDVYDFINFDSSGRYSNGNKYKLNYSFIMPFLISNNLINENIILSDIKYEELCSMINRANKSYNLEYDILRPEISYAINVVEKLQIPLAFKKLAIDFLQLLENSKFWSHAHETIQN